MVTNDGCKTIVYGLFLSEFCHCSATLSIFYQTTALSILSMAYKWQDIIKRKKAYTCNMIMEE